MEGKAILRHARVAPRKTRIVADLVRGLHVSRALEVLAFVERRPAKVLAKVISSAAANAREKGGGNVDDLIVSEVFVDQGPYMRRFMPRAMGRATRILKKTSHITVVVGA